MVPSLAVILLLEIIVLLETIVKLVIIVLLVMIQSLNLLLNLMVEFYLEKFIYITIVNFMGFVAIMLILELVLYREFYALMIKIQFIKLKVEKKFPLMALMRLI